MTAEDNMSSREKRTVTVQRRDCMNIVLFASLKRLLWIAFTKNLNQPWHSRIHAPINNWLFSCRWMCPSAGASCVAAGSSSRRSDASLTFRSARMRCHLLSFSGEPAFTWTASGPLPTSKEKRTSVEAASGKTETQSQDLLWIFNNIQVPFYFPSILPSAY